MGITSTPQKISVLSAHKDVLDEPFKFSIWTFSYSTNPGRKLLKFSWFWAITNTGQMVNESTTQNISVLSASEDI
jgi:hypothetical protein